MITPGYLDCASAAVLFFILSLSLSLTFNERARVPLATILSHAVAALAF